MWSLKKYYHGNNCCLNTAAAVTHVVYSLTAVATEDWSQYRRSSNPCGQKQEMQISNDAFCLNTAAAVTHVVRNANF